MTAGIRRTLGAFGLVTVITAASWPVIGELLNRQVHSVRVAGDLQHVSRDALEQAVLDELGASRFFQVDVEGVRRAALALPWIREVTVRRVWPDSIHIAVVERVAVARWNADALVEDDTSVFRPEDGIEAHHHLVRLEGPKGAHAAVLREYKRLAAGLARLAGGVSRVSLSSRGEWEIEFDNGLTLVPPAPLDVVALLDFAGSLPGVLGGELQRAARIDLRYANGFAVRWRDAVAQPQGGEG